MIMKLGFEFLLFGFLGLGLEVAFTAALDYLQSGDRRLMGYSSLLYFAFYGLTPIFFLSARPVVFRLPLLARGAVYALCALAAEYSAMGLLRLVFGSSPSEKNYYQARWNVHGLIRLDFAPAWFAAGLFLECVFRALN
jgi:hypothetical protein